MRPFCYISLLTLLTVVTTFAQNARLGVGIRAGVGWAGSGRLIQIDREGADQYGRGLALTGGVRLQYRFIDRLLLAVETDWQRMNDKRTRIFTPLSANIPIGRATSDYNNQLTWLRTAVSLQFQPLPKFRALYISAGIGPALLLNGHTNFTGYSTWSGELPDGFLDIPLDIPTNRHLRREWVAVGSVGVTVRKKLSLELTYQHIKPIAYATFDPGNTFINPPVYITRAGQGWLITTTYWIR